MKIIATADLHGVLPKIPECDLLVIAGDISPVRGLHRPIEQIQWFKEKFIPWMQELNAGMIVLVAGNHDFFPETADGQKALIEAEHIDERFYYLEDVSVRCPYDKPQIWVYGTPWTHKLVSWAFQAADGSKEEKYHNIFTEREGTLPAAAELWRTIPEDLDILVCHGPPRGYGDQVSFSHVGSKTLLKVIQEKKPKILICGHIHEGYGHYKCFDTDVYCVSHMDRAYNPINPPVEIEI